MEVKIDEVFHLFSWRNDEFLNFVKLKAFIRKVIKIALFKISLGDMRQLKSSNKTFCFRVQIIIQHQ